MSEDAFEDAGTDLGRNPDSVHLAKALTLLTSRAWAPGDVKNLDKLIDQVVDQDEAHKN